MWASLRSMSPTRPSAAQLVVRQKKMNGYEALDFFSRVFTLAANVIVAGVCFTGFQKLRIRALKLIALSASIAVFASFADALLLQRATDTSTYSFLWIGITILWTIDLGLYALGVTKLIAWITRQKLG